MKSLIYILFFIIGVSLNGQTMFDYEKEITDIHKYTFEEIQTSTSDTAVTLFGTLITPKKNFNKIIVIVPGSGNISQYGYNYLAENFLENNIGVFRYDRRGVGKSGGTISGDINRYSEDLLQILESLHKSSSTIGKSIGALGHSQGGIAIMETIKKGAEIDFLVQWATPVGKPGDIVEYQIKLGSNNYNDIGGRNLEERIAILKFVNEIIDKNHSEGTWEIWTAIKKEGRKRNYNRRYFKDYVVHHNVLFAKINNTTTYENLDIPTLFIIGGKDKLVDPIRTAQSLKEINNDHITVRTFDNLNHFLKQKDIKMSSSMTNEIFNVDLNAKNYITNWIIELPNNADNNEVN